MKVKPITEQERTKYQEEQMEVIVASNRRRKQIKRNFAAYLNDSCGEYQTELAKEIVK